MGTEQPRAAVDIVIPFYKNAGLVQPLFESLGDTAEELNRSGCSVIAINDSPDDPQLAGVLTQAVERLSQSVPCRLIRNDGNLGWVRSANLGLRIALSAGHDVILLNSDTIVFQGAIAEICRVAYLDPMTGFVSPRSNNATLCSLPHQAEFRKVPPGEAFAIFSELSKHLPAYHYLPTVVGFCLFIKQEILAEFGLLDESYGAGYNEENDLIMRANRCGYRSVLANHAFVYHVGECSFTASDSPKLVLEKRNEKILTDRYPEYITSLTQYFEGAHYHAERMVTALLPDSQGRLDLVFDFSSMGPYHNGTFEAAKNILRWAAESWQHWFHVHVMISDEALRFHKLDRLKHVFFVSPESERIFAIAFRLGQPFDYAHIFRMSRMAVLNVYGMLDTIAFDCLHLNHADLSVIWGAVFEHADGVVYISDFVREQFRRRFRMRPELQELVAYLSLDLRDYTPAGVSSNGSGSYILVIGNAFAHKNVPVTVDALNRAFPREKIVALGINSDERKNVIGYKSGELTEAKMHSLLQGSKFVVYPSLYEGFGIPVLESLAYRKPVLARSIPVMCDVRERIDAKDNLILYSSTHDLIARLMHSFPVWKPVTAEVHNAESGSWEAVACRIGEFLRGLVEGWTFSGALVPRLERMKLLHEYTQLLSGSKPASRKTRDDQVAGDQSTAGRQQLNNILRSMEDLKLALQDRDTRITDIYNSLSWRITGPLRTLGSVYLRLFNR